MELSDRIAAFSHLGDALRNDSDAKRFAIGKANYENKWFTEPEITRMLDAICDHYLEFESLSAFADQYDSSSVDEKVVGLIPAGNIPMVGWHDIQCILLAGHHAQVKLSDKDKVLIPWILSELEGINLELARRVQFVNKLDGFDAVIATGSNNSARIFEQYFGQYPHVIRNNKTGVAVLNGSESEADLIRLSNDVFSYFGLGCRNTSKLYVPEGYDFRHLGEALNREKERVLHSKYKNNFDYNLAVTMMNKDTFINTGSIILIEKETIHSRIGSLHYEFYKDLEDLTSKIQSQISDTQCITANFDLADLDVHPLGHAQQPSLSDYADRVDTMQFLLSLS